MLGVRQVAPLDSTVEGYGGIGQVDLDVEAGVDDRLVVVRRRIAAQPPHLVAPSVEHDRGVVLRARADHEQRMAWPGSLNTCNH